MSSRPLPLLLLSACALIVLPAQGQDGPLDPSFGEGGRVIFDEPGSTANDVILQPDGKLIVVGRIARGVSNDHAVVRLLPDGTLDPTFGENGVVRTGVNLYAVTLQEDGGIIAAGGEAAFVLMRLTPDGTPDSSFGDNGVIGTGFSPLGVPTNVLDVVVQPDGRILAAGVHAWRDLAYDDEDFVVARYTADGRADSTFSDDGVLVVDFGSAWQFESARAIAVQPDGRIVVAGKVAAYDRPALAAVRLLPDGALDPTFGEGGIITTSVHNGAVANALALLPDGRIVLGGTITQASYKFLGYVPIDVILARYLPEGTLDATFGQDGIVRTNVYLNDAGLDMARGPDGRLTVAGFARNSSPSSEHRFAVVHYTADGALDGSFGEGGIAFTSFGGSGAVANAVAVQPDGRVVVAGYSSDGETTTAVLARYLDAPPVPTEEEPGEVALALGPPFPNPARGVVTIPFSTVTGGLVRLTVHDVLGRELAVLAEGQMAGGRHEATFAAVALPVGVYVLRLQAGGDVRAGRLTVTR